MTASGLANRFIANRLLADRSSANRFFARLPHSQPTAQQADRVHCLFLTKAPAMPKPDSNPAQRKPASATYADAGVDITAGDRAKQRIKYLARKTFTSSARRNRRIRRPLLARRQVSGAGAGLFGRWRGHQAQGRLRARHSPHRRRRSRQPLRQRHRRAGRDAALLPRLPRYRQPRRARSPRSVVPGLSEPAAPTAARSSAAKPPRCPASTPMASTTSPASSSAASTAPIITGAKFESAMS